MAYFGKLLFLGLVSALFVACHTCEAMADEAIAPARTLLADAASKARDGAAALAAPPIRTTTDDGVPLNELIDVQVRNVRLRIPAGYLAPWPTQAMRNKLNVFEGLNFNLWMPEKRYPDIDPLLLQNRTRPNEEGRPEPQSYSSAIQVRGLRPVSLGEPDYTSPAELFHQKAAHAGLASFSFEEENFGLNRFWQHNSKRRPLLATYRTPQGLNPQALIECTPDDVAARDRACTAEVFFAEDEGLGFFLYFARSDLPRWLTIARSVRDLFSSWTVAVDPRPAGLPLSLDFHRYDTAGRKAERIEAALRDLNLAFPRGSDVHVLIQSIINQRGSCRRLINIREIDKPHYKSDGNIHCEIWYLLPDEYLSETYIGWDILVGYEKSTGRIEETRADLHSY